jgi:hypothetical protein
MILSWAYRRSWGTWWAETRQALQSLAAVIQMKMMIQAKVFSDYGTSQDAEKTKPGC